MSFSLNGKLVSLSCPADPIDRLERDVALILLSSTFAGLVLREIQTIRRRGRGRGRGDGGGEMVRSFHLQCRSVDDFERLAETILPSHRFFYYSYKAGRGITNKLTRRYFDEELLIIPRVLIHLPEVSLRVTLFG